MVKRALLVLLGKLVLIVASFVGLSFWFKMAPPPSISANERLLNHVLALATAGSFSAVIALLNRSNFWRTFTTAAIVGIGAAVGSQITNSKFPMTDLYAEIAGAFVGLALSQFILRRTGERPVLGTPS